MAVSRFSTSRVGAGLPKYQKFWDGTSVYSPTSYESIATVTVGAGTTPTVSFTSIPQTYKHLEIRAMVRDDRTATVANAVRMQYNSDTSTNYTYHVLSGDGVSASASYSINESVLVFGDCTSASANASNFAPSIVTIMDYTDTNKYKTHSSISGYDTNGGGEAVLWSGLWRSTAAITRIDIKIQGATTTFAQNSKFALYGIKG